MKARISVEYEIDLRAELYPEGLSFEGMLALEIETANDSPTEAVDNALWHEDSKIKISGKLLDE